LPHGHYVPFGLWWKDFPTDGEPNVVSVSMPTAKLGGNPPAAAPLPAGGISSEHQNVDFEVQRGNLELPRGDFLFRKGRFRPIFPKQFPFSGQFEPIMTE
jgi:hypothetical protein